MDCISSFSRKISAIVLLSLLVCTAGMSTAQAGSLESWLSSGAPLKLRPSLSLDVGGRSFDAPTYGAGTVVRVGGEGPLIKLGGRMRGTAAAISIIYPLAVMTASTASAESMAFRMSSWPRSSQPFLFGGFHHFTATEEHEGLEPVGGDNVGSTYGINNPMSSSTGIFLGASGLYGSGESSLDNYKLTLGIGNAFNLNSTTLTPRIAFNYESLDNNSEAWITSPSFTMMDYNQGTYVDLEGDRYSLGVGLDVGRKVTSKLTLGASIGLDAVYYNNDLSFRQYNVCGACGMASPEYRYNVMLDDSAKGWTYQASLGVSAMYEIQKNFEIGIGIKQEYYGDVAKLDSRDNPNEAAPHLTEDDTDSTTAVMKLKLSF
jgi:hypothetical protein